MDYLIKDPGDFFYPKTYQWINDTFNVAVDRAVAYQMIIDKGFLTWTPEWFAEVLRYSRSTVKRILDDFVEREMVKKRTINTSTDGYRLRTVYVALYTRAGKRSDEEVEYLLQTGIKKITSEYANGKQYNRKRKKR